MSEVLTSDLLKLENQAEAGHDGSAPQVDVLNRLFEEAKDAYGLLTKGVQVKQLKATYVTQVAAVLAGHPLDSLVEALRDLDKIGLDRLLELGEDVSNSGYLNQGIENPPSRNDNGGGSLREVS